MARLNDDDRAVFEAVGNRPLHFSIVRFRNHGGIPMPLPLEIRHTDGTVREVMLPVEIWKQDPTVATKMFVGPHAVERVILDPYRELADADRTNNAYPPEVIAGRFGLNPGSDRSNPMQSARADDGRARFETAAATIGDRLAAGWTELGDGDATPLAASNELLKQVDPKLLVDPWGRAMRLEFTAVPVALGTSEVIATLRSDGRDGRRGNDDDIALAILADGKTIDQDIANARNQSEKDAD